MQSHKLPLAGVAKRAGFHVVIEGPTYLELSGPGDIEALKAACTRIMQKSERDHVMLILRGKHGRRTLLDIGERGERTGKLPDAKRGWVCKPHLLNPQVAMQIMAAIKVVDEQYVSIPS